MTGNMVNLLKLIIDHFWLLVSLEPHHILGVKPPTLLLQRLSGKVLRLGALHIIENEEERLRRKSLEEVNGITALWGCLQYYGNISSEINNIWFVLPGDSKVECDTGSWAGRVAVSQSPMDGADGEKQLPAC